MLRTFLVLMTLCCFFQTSFAEENFGKGTELKSGLFYLKTTTGTGNSIHFVTVDLTVGNKIRVSKHTEGVRTPKQFARNIGAYIAVNADFFDSGRGYIPLGLSMGEGVRWPGTQVMPNWYVLACDQANACEIRPFSKTEPLKPGWKNVVGGRDLIAKNGIPWTRQNDNSCPHLCPFEAPRTAVGLSADNTQLIIGVAEGYGELEGGVRVSDMAAAMVAQGASHVLHLDGGGSSQLVIDGALKTRRPDNEPQERVVGNILGIMLPK